MKKICKICKEEKELNYFGKRKKSKDGYRNQCLKCLTNQAKYRIENLSDCEKNKLRIRKNELRRIYWKETQQNPESKKSDSKIRRDRHVKRLETDTLYKLKISYTRRLNKCIKRFNIKNTNFLEKLGCTLEYLQIHIESNFKDWMNWGNYGKYNGEFNYGWDIDHIKPISLAKNEEEFFKLSHYTNLQPLCSKINRDIKKDK